MLKKPRSENVCGYFGENAAFLLVLFTIWLVVIFTRTFSTSNWCITCIAWNKKEKKIVK